MMLATVGQTTTAPGAGTTITISGTPNTKGAWIQLTAATPFDAHELFVKPGTSYLGTTATSLFDIGVGAAGAEQVIIPNVLWVQDQWCGFASGGGLKFPVSIPKGSRIAARAQGGAGAVSPTLTLTFINCGGDKPKSGKVFDIGTNLAASSATALALATAAKSAWVQLTAATAQRMDGFFLCLGNNGASVTTSQWARLDIGVGAAGAEQVVLADYVAGVDSNSELFLPVYSPLFPIKIPKGQRIAARGQGSVADNIYVQLLGIG